MDQGIKADAEKSRLDLIDPEWLLEVGDVLGFGAKKYKAYNWRKVSVDRYIAAIMRHTLALMQGEYIDPESGKSHTSHIACNAMFIHYLTRVRK